MCSTKKISSLSPYSYRDVTVPIISAPIYVGSENSDPRSFYHHWYLVVISSTGKCYQSSPSLFVTTEENETAAL